MTKFKSFKGERFAEMNEVLSYLKNNNNSIMMDGCDNSHISLTKTAEGYRLEMCVLDPETHKIMDGYRHETMLLGKRMTERMKGIIANAIEQFAEYLIERMEEDAFDEVVDKMADVVLNYQTEMDDLISSANFWNSHENTALTLEYLERINALCNRVIEVCSVISQCNMVPDDGFYPDLSSLYLVKGCGMGSNGKIETALIDEIDTLKGKLAA